MDKWSEIFKHLKKNQKITTIPSSNVILSHSKKKLQQYPVVVLFIVNGSYL